MERVLLRPIVLWLGACLYAVTSLGLAALSFGPVDRSGVYVAVLLGIGGYVSGSALLKSPRLGKLGVASLGVCLGCYRVLAVFLASEHFSPRLVASAIANTSGLVLFGVFLSGLLPPLICWRVVLWQRGRIVTLVFLAGVVAVCSSWGTSGIAVFWTGIAALEVAVIGLVLLVCPFEGFAESPKRDPRTLGQLWGELGDREGER